MDKILKFEEIFQPIAYISLDNYENAIYDDGTNYWLEIKDQLFMLDRDERVLNAIKYMWDRNLLIHVEKDLVWVYDASIKFCGLRHLIIAAFEKQDLWKEIEKIHGRKTLLVNADQNWNYTRKNLGFLATPRTIWNDNHNFYIKLQPSNTAYYTNNKPELINILQNITWDLINNRKNLREHMGSHYSFYQYIMAYKLKTDINDLYANYEKGVIDHLDSNRFNNRMENLSIMEKNTNLLKGNITEQLCIYPFFHYGVYCDSEYRIAMGYVDENNGDKVVCQCCRYENSVEYVQDLRRFYFEGILEIDGKEIKTPKIPRKTYKTKKDNDALDSTESIMKWKHDDIIDKLLKAEDLPLYKPAEKKTA